jgi:hypothetical protein
MDEGNIGAWAVAFTACQKNRTRRCQVVLNAYNTLKTSGLAASSWSAPVTCIGQLLDYSPRRGELKDLYMPTPLQSC